MDTIKEINKRYISGVDKYYRMFGGAATELLDFKNETIYLEIRVDGRWQKDAYATCRQKAYRLMEYSPLLSGAKKFHVKYIWTKAAQVGFSISLKNVNKENVDEVAEELWEQISNMKAPEITKEMIFEDWIDAPRFKPSQN